jgi:hypothetical protein
MGGKPRKERIDRNTVKDLKWIREQADLGWNWKCAIEVSPREAALILDALRER